MNEQGLVRLREFLFKEFNEEELVALCQEIGLDYTKLPGEGAFGKTRGMVEAADARDVVPMLMSRVRDLRPAAYRIAAIRTPGPHVTPPAQPAAAPVQATPFAKLSARLPLIMLIVVVCLAGSTGAVILNQWMLNQRNVTPATPAGVIASSTDLTGSTVTSTTNVGATVAATMTGPPIAPTETPVVQPSTVIAATVRPLDTPVPTATATATPTSTPQATEPTRTPSQTPSPTTTSTSAPSPTTIAVATAPVSSTNASSAVQAVIDANDQLAAFYSGRITGDSLKQTWAGDTYPFVIAYPTKILKRSLGLDVKPGEGLTATMSYVAAPAVVNEAGGRFQLASRELWNYKVANLVVCETVDYSYTLIKPADRYQIAAYKGDVITTGTGAACQ